jgi:predicted dithiol-disulfide oxidoreductase (DUF899 family)
MAGSAQGAAGQGEGVDQGRDELNSTRRSLPMVEVTKNYELHSERGPIALIDLFEGRDQLIVHHFMWTYDLDEDGTEHPRDEGCPSCSATADDIGNLTGLGAQGTTLAAVSRAPIDNIAAFKRRMGWTFPWYSSAGKRLQLRLPCHCRRPSRAGSAELP